MKNLNNVAQQLFNQIRGRFPSVEIGDANGNVTNEPTAARFFEFEYESAGRNLGKINASIDEQDGLVLMFNKDFLEDAIGNQRETWFDFLKGMRSFAKKRLMKFEVRDINRSNLTKRDFKFLATNRPGETTMAESKLYGTNKTSYQKVGNARIAIKHNAAINVESANNRTKNIGNIYIESAEGERFKYPFKHLSGARAMARHVSEGGNAYDDFGKHITNMSEELSKLRKFKTYMGRSAVMAESLSGYMDVVNERINSVRKTIQSIQKESNYKNAFENFSPAAKTEVPDDIKENWIDQLTIKQFNEELADVFPYIYDLVSESSRAESLSFDDIIGEVDQASINNAVKQAMEPPAATTGEVYHAVRQGDTVDSLARKFNITKFDIQEVNGLDDNFTIKIGEKILLPKVSQRQYNAVYSSNIGAGSQTAQMPNGAVDGSTRGIDPKDAYGDDYKKLTQSTYESQIDNAFEEMMGQFGEGWFGGGWDEVINQINIAKQQKEKYPSADLDLPALFDALRKVGISYKTDPDHMKMFNTWANHLNNGTKDPLSAQRTLLGLVDQMKKQGIGEEEVVSEFQALNSTPIDKTGRVQGTNIFIQRDGTQGSRPDTGYDENDPTMSAKIAAGEKAARGGAPAAGKVQLSRQSPAPTPATAPATGSNPNNPQDYAANTTKELGDGFNSVKVDAFGKTDIPAVHDVQGNIYIMPNNGYVRSPAKYVIVKDGQPFPEANPGPMTMKALQAAGLAESFGESTEDCSSDNGDVEEKRIPIGEFILSYFDRENGQFPKGETAILTAVGKEYGEQYIQPANKFIERISQTYETYSMNNQNSEPEIQENPELTDIARLAGLR
jgi:LysM repeat protein